MSNEPGPTGPEREPTYQRRLRDTCRQLQPYLAGQQRIYVVSVQFGLTLLGALTAASPVVSFLRHPGRAATVVAAVLAVVGLALLLGSYIWARRRGRLVSVDGGHIRGDGPFRGLTSVERARLSRIVRGEEVATLRLEPAVMLLQLDIRRRVSRALPASLVGFLFVEVASVFSFGLPVLLAAFGAVIVVIVVLIVIERRREAKWRATLERQQHDLAPA